MGIKEDFIKKSSVLNFCDIIFSPISDEGAGYNFGRKRLRPEKIRDNISKSIDEGSLFSKPNLKSLLIKKKNAILLSNNLLDFQLEGKWPSGFRFGPIHKGGQDLERKIYHLVNEAGYNSFCEYYCVNENNEPNSHFLIYSKMCKEELREKLSTSSASEFLDLLSFYFIHNYPEYLSPLIIDGTIKKKALSVLRLTALGLNSREISEMLNITTRGVDYHIEKAKSQLGAANKAELVNIAKSLCLIK
ncbi:helix-turn-helix transcriptional regulator [Ferrimonas kyonanensis]|uniref:helix-turn-helix transcriptional regulator n=1 Tax=Ferrimonas kyonanensis TaxID=364763 RepID=UPI000484AAA7|nr:helix-turn-helix transcriptional regulator [Ferrimonas kyonanensis]